MKNLRVFITGCGGMLGGAIYPYFVLRHKDVLATDKTVNEKWLEPLDVRDNGHLSYIFKDFKPDIVLHLAAETDLEYCETHSGIAIDTNSRATEVIAKLCEEYRSTLIYISTAGVFDGRKGSFYTENDLPNPIMVYGQTKYEGEIHALNNSSKTFVVRAGWMMGGGRHKEKKFIYKILRQVMEGKKEIFAVTDRWGTPTYTYDFVKNLFCLIDTKKFGTYHMACEGMGNRYDVAKEILKICNRTDIKLTPVSSEFFKEEYFVVRPMSEMLINANLTKMGLNHMRLWRDTLGDYITNYFFDFISQQDADRIEKRKHYRKSCNIPVKYAVQGASEKDVHSGVILDRCVSGAGLLTDMPLKSGQIIMVNADSTGASPCDCGADKVIAKTEGNYRIGLESLLNNHFIVTSVLELKCERKVAPDNESSVSL